MQAAVQEFLIGFPALFSIVNPASAAFIFREVTADRSHAELEIFDDGVGIPAGRVETAAGTRDGIGIQLIRGFARQLGATLQVEEGHGTRYKLHLPLQRKRLDGPLLGPLASKTPA